MNQRQTLFLCLCACFFFCNAHVVFSQLEYKPLTYGLFAGYNLNSHSANFTGLPGVPSCCDQFTGGSGSGISAAVFLDYELTSRFSLQARLGYQQLSGLLEREKNIGNTPVLSGSVQSSVPVTVLHSIDASLATLQLEATGNYALTTSIFVQGGFAVGTFMTASYAQKEEIIRPLTVTFLDKRVIRNDLSGDIPEKNSLRLAAIVGAGFELPISQTLQIIPEARYFYPLSNISSVDWNVSSLQFGLGVKYRPFYEESNPLEPGMKH